MVERAPSRPPRVKGPRPRADTSGWRSARPCRGRQSTASECRLMKVRPPLNAERILRWADAHRRRTGRWPTSDSGDVFGVPGQTWQAVNRALFVGSRGLPGGSSLARLLARRRGKRNQAEAPRLREEQILLWADRHYRRTGQWPSPASGPVAEAPGENWRALASAL